MKWRALFRATALSGSAMLALVGCTSGVRTDNAGVHTSRCPDGGFSRCHDQAKRFCGRRGYLALSEVSDSGSRSGGADESLINARERVRILTFQCKPEP